MCEYTPRDLRADVRLVQAAIELAREARDTAGDGALAQLLSIGATLERTSRAGAMHAARLLPDFMRAHPDIFWRLLERDCDATLAFVANVLSYYGAVKQRRELTDDEKSIGRALRELLDTMQATLDEARRGLSPDEEKRSGGTP